VKRRIKIFFPIAKKREKLLFNEGNKRPESGKEKKT